jgi:AraC-like DNA-binding protein
MYLERASYAMPLPRLPGEVPGLFPAKADQARLGWLRPYVREAVHTFRPTWTIGPRRLLDYLILYVIDGEIELHLNGETWRAGPGNLLWIPPNQPHAMTGAAPGTRMLYVHADLIYDPARSHWAAMIPQGTLDLSPWQPLRHPALPDPKLAAWRGLLPAAGEEAGRLLERVVAEFTAQGCCTLRCSALMLELLAVMLTPAAVPATSRFPEGGVMDEAIMRLREQMPHCDLAALARHCRLSPSHFRRLFQRRFGHSPRQALASEKMKRACQLLAYTDQTASAIAAGLGFTTVQNFSRAFRAHTGSSPRAFRRGA